VTVRKVALALGILFLGAGTLVGCPAGFMAISMHEPPSPLWNFHPEVGKNSETPKLSAGSYAVWVNQPCAGTRCKLTVHRSNGSLVGTDESARYCSVYGKAASEEVWRIEATGAPDAIGGLSPDTPVQLPWSLRIGLGGAVLALIIGVALLIAAAVAPARAPTPWEPGAR
jgi:hypothetical protein